MDGAEFILVSIAAKQSMKTKQLAEKSQFFQRVLKKKFRRQKNGQFRKFFKGLLLCILAKIAHFEYLLVSIEPRINCASIVTTLAKI